MKTIRRKTKMFTEVLENAKEIYCYSLNNNFTGRLMNDTGHDMPPQKRLAEELQKFNFAKLVDKGNGKYTVDVH